MSQERIAPELRTVKLDYNPANINEVYEIIRLCAPGLTAKDFTPELIEKFIPEDADPATWTKNLRNVEYNRSKPEKTKRNRYTSKGNRKYNPAEAIAKATTFNALMEVV